MKSLSDTHDDLMLSSALLTEDITVITANSKISCESGGKPNEEGEKI